MKRRTFLAGAGTVTAAAAMQWGSQGASALVAGPEREFRIFASTSAPAEVRSAASLLAEGSSPVLAALGKDKTVHLSASRAPFTKLDTELAFSHLIVVGLPDDPLVQAVWQREARVIDGGLYIFGFGYLKGDIGYIESDRNPLLHSAVVPRAPFEAECVTITGSTPAGVLLAAQAFLQANLLNGVVAGPGWARPQTTLLDRDPLPATVKAPMLPGKAGAEKLLGWTQASEDEYRGVLADTRMMPRRIVRAKYHQTGDWDGVGAETAFAAYMNGLHRRAYGRTLWIAEFEDQAMASAAAPKIAAAAGLHRDGGRWSGEQPMYGFPNPAERKPPLQLAQSGPLVWMSTLENFSTDLITSSI